MTQEEKNLLLKDLCARLPYGVKVFIQDTTGKHSTITERIFDTYVLQFLSNNNILIKPYLRPMSSMTEEEYSELKKISSYYGFAPFEYIHDWAPNYEMTDWLNAHHFDYRGLIGKGLALEAPEGMYNLEKK